MNGKKITQKEINEIIRLRQTGHSLPEIRTIIRRGNGTIYKYIKEIKILPEYQQILKEKQGGSKARSTRQWKEAEKQAEKLINHVLTKEKLLIAACLYWGEGTKREFGLSNTDPALIQTFITAIREIGITKKDLKITIRTYEDLNKNKVIAYWAKIIGIPKKQITNVNVLKGKKHGKLQYGMCRIRVTKGGWHLKLLQSIIKIIQNKIMASPRSSMDRTAHS